MILALRLLQQQLAFDRKIKPLREDRYGKRGEHPVEIDINLIDIVADLIGVPQDCTVGTLGGYCRDWMLSEWDSVVSDQQSVEQFVDKLRHESEDPYAVWFWNYLDCQEEIDSTCAEFGWTKEEREQHLQFVKECFESGIKPTHFVDVLIQAQRDFNNKEKYAERFAARLNKRKKDRPHDFDAGEENT
jgi:hypothetical protein